MKSYRIGLTITAFATADVISLQRIEERILKALPDLILDDYDGDAKAGPKDQVFGYVVNPSLEEMKVQRKEQ